MHSDRIVSLRDMFELNANTFLQAATNLARMHQIIAGLDGANALSKGDADTIEEFVTLFRIEVDNLGATLAVMAADRLTSQLKIDPCPLTVARAENALSELERRFGDYLTQTKMFSLNAEESKFLEAADDLVGHVGFSSAFPRTSFEVEEAAKCLALGRYTASVFHAMRMLELGIRALAKRLSIPDPTKPAEKNWSNILRIVKEKIDEQYPRPMPGSEGALFEELYANLEAVRNPWRNATMHVETIYAPHEAIHILRCAAFFMTKLANLSDEEGNPPDPPSLPGLEAS